MPLGTKPTCNSQPPLHTVQELTQDFLLLCIDLAVLSTAAVLLMLCRTALIQLLQLLLCSTVHA